MQQMGAPDFDIPPINPGDIKFPEQDENGIDLSLIRRNLRKTPLQRLRRADRGRRDALRLLEYGRRNREKLT